MFLEKLPKDFLSDFKNKKETNFWFEINDIMLLECDETNNSGFNELVKFLKTLNKDSFDMEYLKKAEMFLQEEIKEKDDKKLFKEILPNIEVNKDDLLNNTDFLDKYFEKEEYALTSWENSFIETPHVEYQFNFNKFKNFAWCLRRNIYYKFLKEGYKNKNLHIDKETFDKYNYFFAKCFDVKTELDLWEQDEINLNIESKKIVLTLKDDL